MDNNNSNKEIQLFKFLFKGREDVFAVRWEKGSKNGYMPAYFFDPYMYRAHKISGGTFQNYSDKKYLPLTDIEIEKHLNGEHLIGIYPLLTDNTSWFIVADFDKTNWFEESKIFITACNEKGIPAYLERSRSGKGGHVWIFFDDAYSAAKDLLSNIKKTDCFEGFPKSILFETFMNIVNLINKATFYFEPSVFM